MKQAARMYNGRWMLGIILSIQCRHTVIHMHEISCIHIEMLLNTHVSCKLHCNYDCSGNYVAIYEAVLLFVITYTHVVHA